MEWLSTTMRLGFALVAVLATGWLAAVVLARLAGKAAPLPRPNRLGGWDLLVALGLFAGVGWWLHRGELGGTEANGISVAEFGVLAAAEGAALLWFLLRSGVRGMSGMSQEVPAPADRSPAWAARSYLAVVPLLLALTYLLGLVYPWVGLGEAPDRLVRGLSTLDRQDQWLALTFAVLLLPLLEEVVFRGYLWHAMAGRKDFGPRRALLYTTLLFTVMHAPSAWPVLFVLGAILGWIRWRGGRLRLAVGVHVAHNGLAALLTLPQ